MPLVGPETPIGRDELDAMYAEHREEIVAQLDRLVHPPSSGGNPTGRFQTEELARNMLAILPERSQSIPDDQIRLYVNASYDLMVTVIELTKIHLGLPTVPQRKP